MAPHRTFRFPSVKSKNSSKPARFCTWHIIFTLSCAKPHLTLTRLLVLSYSFNTFLAYETNQCKCCDMMNKVNIFINMNFCCIVRKALWQEERKTKSSITTCSYLLNFLFSSHRVDNLKSLKKTCINCHTGKEHNAHCSLGNFCL